MKIFIDYLIMPIQTLIDLVLQNIIVKQKDLIKFHVKTLLVRKKLLFALIFRYLIINKLLYYILESVLSDISYSRVEDSLDSDKNFEDALDRWDPEVIGTVKRKRVSGISNANGLKKEIEVIFFICKEKNT